VKGKPSRRALARLRRGVEVAGRRTVPAQVRVVGVEGDNSWLEITVHEGRYHQVKLMAEAVGHPVLRLVRTRMGPLQLGRLEPGRFRFLTLREVTLLRQVAAQTGGKPRQEANMKAQG
jgi:pseudouridine synthase